MTRTATVATCQPASSAAASSATITHHDLTRWRRFDQSDFGLTSGRTRPASVPRSSSAEHARPGPRAPAGRRRGSTSPGRRISDGSLSRRTWVHDAQNRRGKPTLSLYDRVRRREARRVTDIANRRPLKSRDAGWAKGLARDLARAGVTPDAVSFFSFAFAFVGACGARGLQPDLRRLAHPDAGDRGGGDPAPARLQPARRHGGGGARQGGPARPDLERAAGPVQRRGPDGGRRARRQPDRLFPRARRSAGSAPCWRS